MRARLTAGLLGLAVALGLAAGAGPANASTGGARDGDRHANVALIVGYADGARYRCSATLVAESVLLTAAHCFAGADGEVLVTFDSVVAEEPPAPFPAAADPSTGYSSDEITAAGYLTGAAHMHPQYFQASGEGVRNDVGVVVLERPVRDLRPALLAPVGTLDAYAPPRLSSTLFTAVGYGSEVRRAESGPQRPQPEPFPMVRRYVEMPGQKLTAHLLQTNGNEKDPRGTGGSCLGDSGGPVLLQDQVVAVTSFVYNHSCRYLSGHQRVDIGVVRDWLARFGV